MPASALARKHPLTKPTEPSLWMGSQLCIPCTEPSHAADVAQPGQYQR